MNIWTWLASHKDALEALKSLLTAVALIIGGVWSYQMFIRKRQTYPRAKLEHRITSWKLPDGPTLLQVTIHVQNPSEVLLKLVTGHILPSAQDE